MMTQILTGEQNHGGAVFSMRAVRQLSQEPERTVCLPMQL